MATLPTDFKDDILDSTMNGKRRYQVINNADGTISLEDVTTYTQEGSTFGQSQVNAICETVNGKTDESSALATYSEVMAATNEGFYPDALAVKTGFTQLNTNLESKVPTEKGVGGTLFKCTGGNLAMFYFDGSGNISIRFGSSSGYTYVGIRPDGIYCNNVKKVAFT